MVREGPEGSEGEGVGEEGPQGQAGDLPDEEGLLGEAVGQRTPLYEAHHAPRYERQDLIKRYQERHDCRLIVVIDALFPDSIVVFEDLIHDADPEEDLHLLLWTPGGDGETAIRMVRSVQARCREFTLIVPDVAKSAGTLIALGAHEVMTGPTSDFGPIDPQFRMSDGELVAAKDIISAVEAAEEAIQRNPDTYPLHAALLENVSGLMVQQARSGLARTSDLMREALASRPGRTKEEVTQLCNELGRVLIEDPKTHSAVFGPDDALKASLPVVKCDPGGEYWQFVWRLFAKYYELLPARVYEGFRGSHVLQQPAPPYPS